VTQHGLAYSKEGMMVIKEFATRYNITPSWARRQIARGQLCSEMINGQRHITLEEAERWFGEQRYRDWVRNLSHPDQPPVALGEPDFFVLMLCVFNYNASGVHTRRKIDMRVECLRQHGFNIERICTGGIFPRYCLRDVVDVESDGDVFRMGPHSLFSEERQT
jgi:hypothetical protein